MHLNLGMAGGPFLVMVLRESRELKSKCLPQPVQLDTTLLVDYHYHRRQTRRWCRSRIGRGGVSFGGGGNNSRSTCYDHAIPHV